MAPDSIPTVRLELVVLGRAYLEGWLTGDPPNLGFSDPLDVLVRAEDLVRLRLEQLLRDASIAPWLLRAVVSRVDRIAIGFVGFHAAPVGGVAEIGYEIHPDFQRHGYASEASAALILWAAGHGVRTVRASVSPTNEASIALLQRQGFVHAGEQIDEEDGLELVYEKAV